MIEVHIDTSEPHLETSNSEGVPITAISEALLATPLHDRVGLDTETTGVRSSECALVGVSLSCNGRHFYSPIAHRVPGFRNDDGREILSILRSMLRGRTITLHNASFDTVVLRRHGLDLEDLEVSLFDTFLAAHLTDTTRRRIGESNKLKELSKIILGIDQPTYEEVAGDIGFQFVDPFLGAIYACFDTYCTLLLAKEFESRLDAIGSLDYFHAVEMPNVWNTAEMMSHGVPIDTALLETMSKNTSAVLAALEERIFKALGHVFDITSSQQLGYALFGKRNGARKFEPIGKTETGAYDTSGQALRLLYREVPESQAVVVDILQYRKLSKLNAAYIEKFSRFHDPLTYRAHANFVPSTITGRYISSAPNLLSIPKRHEVSASVVRDSGFAAEFECEESGGDKDTSTVDFSARRIIAAPTGWILVVADFSQIDMRGIGHYSNDPTLLSAFVQGKDLHLETLRQLFPEEVRGLVDNQCDPADILARDESTEEVVLINGGRIRVDTDKFASLENRRREMKAVNFGLSYGMGPPALLRRLNTPEGIDDLLEFIDRAPWTMDQAEDVYNGFFKRFKKAQDYKEDVRRHMFGAGATRKVPGGAYRNVFGRTVFCSPFNRLWQQVVTIDVRVAEGSFRLLGKVVGMSEEGLTVRLHKATEIELPSHPPMTHEMSSGDKHEYRKYHDEAPERGTVFECEAQVVSDAEENLLAIARQGAISNEQIFEFERAVQKSIRKLQHPAPSFLLMESFNPSLKEAYEAASCEISQSLPYVLVDHKVIQALRLREDGHFIRSSRWSGAFRELASYTISSTSTDIARVAMSRMRREIRCRWPDKSRRPKLLLCVHDELVYEVPGTEEDGEAFKNLLVAVMEKQPHPAFRAKIKASAAIGRTYEEAKP